MLAGSSQSAVSFLDPTISATEGQAFNGVVDMFQPMDGLNDPSNYTASISWGDGQVSGGVITADSQSGGFDVSGSHTYTDDGAYAIQITLQDSAGNTSVLSDSAQVADAALSAQRTIMTAQPGTELADVIGSFTDANPQAQPSDFQASIQWGDGGVSTATIAGNASLFTVNGLHTYVQTGSYSVTVSILDSGGSTTSFTSTIAVGVSLGNGVGLVANDPAINATEGASFSGPVATFTDSDGNTNPALYSASIVWGDGATTTGTVTGTGGSNGFTVSGTHTYAEEGNDAVAVSISDTDGAHFNVNSTAIVADAALTPTAGSGLNPTSGTAYSATWATFTDGDPNGAVSDFSATIAWGDGTVSAGTVATNTGGGFKVTGTHTYPQGGSLQAAVTVYDAGGASGSVTDSVNVAGLTPTGVNFSQNIGTMQSPFPVATFTDSDGNHTPGRYTASINWGDGTTTTGTLSGTGPFTVKGQHGYGQQGYYPVTVSISDTDGARATANSNANVSHGTLSATSQVPSSSTSLMYSGQVATLSDSDGNTAPNYSATINWGDGTTTSGTLSVGPTISGRHSYAAAGTYAVTTIAIDNIDGSAASVSSNMTISLSGPLTLTPTSNLSGNEGTALTNLVVGTFTDSDNNTNPALYTATIVWGDGTSSTGTVTRPGSTFQIAGTHTYAEEGTYPINLTVTDTDSATTQAATTLLANDGALTPTAQLLSPTAGRPMSNTVVATFTDGDSGGVLTDYNALINWGDNSPPTAGAIAVATGGGFDRNEGRLHCDERLRAWA
jgi:hypothetical protein